MRANFVVFMFVNLFVYRAVSVTIR